MNIDYQLIGGRIKSFRKSLGKTQEELAEYLCVSVGYISQIERGVTKINLDTLSRISVFLNCDITDLISSTIPEQTAYLNNELLFYFNHLNESHKNIIIEIMATLLKYQ